LLGNPLGLPINPAPNATFNPISSNVKVYGAIYSAESCSYDPDRGVIVVPNRGVAQNVTQAAPGLGAFANRTRSVQVLDGVWELCEQSRWGGRCVRITSSVPDIGRIGINGVASARPLDRSR